MTQKKLQTLDEIKVAASNIPVPNVLVTLGKDGVYIVSEDTIIPAYKVDAIDTTGAGDAFIGSFVGALARDYDLAYAVQYACKSATISVTKSGAFGTAGSYDEVSKEFS